MNKYAVFHQNYKDKYDRRLVSVVEIAEGVNPLAAHMYGESFLNDPEHYYTVVEQYEEPKFVFITEEILQARLSIIQKQKEIAERQKEINELSKVK